MKASHMKQRTAAEEHELAQHSALHTVRSLGRATVTDVVNQQGLAELRAKRALEDLLASGQVTKDGRYYVSKG